MSDYRRKNGIPRGVKWAIAGLVVLFIGGFVVSFFVVRQRARQEVAAQSAGLQAGMTALQDFNFQAAAREFGIVSQSSTDFENVGGLVSLFSGSGNPVSALVNVSKQLGALSNELSALQAGALGFASGSSSTDIVPNLAALRDTLHAINGDASSLTAAANDFGVSVPGSDNLLSLEAKLSGAETFLEALVPWLENPTPHHVLVLLQNPSELRPTGGFLGSYADVTIASGTIENVSVHDIADVDETFLPNIVPPKTLQPEEKRWRPADSNWFFDFPTSASKTIWFFENSGLYDGVAATGTKETTDTAETAETFDGVIAITPKIISDLLNVTGPIAVSSTGKTAVTFTPDNFLVQVQNIVQAGQALADAGRKVPAAENPKQVLGDLFAGMFSKLATASDTAKQGIVGLAENWVADKDAMIYFKDPAFENFAEAWGAAGDVYQLPQDFEGDYLAIANTNVKGQKSDLYLSESISFESQINADGTVDDQLVIGRTHNGNKSPYWWYSATNQDYIQIFVPDDSTLENESGGVKKTIVAPVNYAKAGYSTDPLVASLESSTQSIFGYPAVTTHEESGKQVFGTWSVVPAGSSSTLSFDYSRRLYVPPEAGTQYQFVFDKQPGATRQYNFEIDAPLGYQFAENGLPSWTYQASDTPGRLVVDLTLEKI